MTKVLPCSGHRWISGYGTTALRFAVGIFGGGVHPPARLAGFAPGGQDGHTGQSSHPFAHARTRDAGGSCRARSRAAARNSSMRRWSLRSLRAGTVPSVSILCLARWRGTREGPGTGVPPRSVSGARSRNAMITASATATSGNCRRCWPRRSGRQQWAG